MGKKDQSSSEAVVADRPAGDSAAVATAEASATSLATQPAIAPSAPTTLAASSALANSKFMAIRPDSSLREAFEANYAYGETMKFGDLTRVKIPSGGLTKWTIEELTGETTVDEITGAIVYYHPAGTLWPTNDMQEGMKPLLRTRDLRVAEQFGDEYGDLNPDVIEEARLIDANGQPMSTADGRGMYDWQKLAYNQWGTGKNGVGKRCKESRQICILRENDQFPIYLQVSVGSLKNVTTFFRKLPGAYWRFVVGLTLEKAKSSGGITFAMVKPRLVYQLSNDEALALKATYTDRLGTAMDEASVDAGAYVYDGDDEGTTSF